MHVPQKNEVINYQYQSETRKKKVTAQTSTNFGVYIRVECRDRVLIYSLKGKHFYIHTRIISAFDFSSQLQMQLLLGSFAEAVYELDLRLEAHDVVERLA